MSDSSQTCVKVEEELPLNVVAGSGDALNDDSNRQKPSSPGWSKAFSCCEDKHHRKLAICSTVCGCCCIGCVALINSAKAEETENPVKAEKYLRKAKKFGIISVVTFISILAAIPALLGLISYLLTLYD
ncbi:transmembrane protein 265-like [Halichoeres trimaculatus]|uniref:transmembrane protein 265-like n=1 Tax=Halichoeres trimaculatus TaxID=147232 RepID=UPI003D9E3384